MINPGILATIVFVAVLAILIILSMTGFKKRIKKDVGITEKEWKKSNKIEYYKIVVGLSGSISIVFMLIYNYVLIV